DFIVATPGRLIDLYKEHIVDLTQVRAVVFDEADRMFDMGFKDDMKYLLKRIPKERQFLVFSATLNFDVMNTAYEFGADPVEVNISKDQAKAENVDDEIFHVGNDNKPSYLLSLLKQHEPRQLIIFSNFKRNVERIALFLNKNGYSALGISSLLTQAQRNRVMAQFKSESDRNILVATDVAARGLDVIGVDMVINYELPDDPENYVHRIGRTGRASSKGKAFSLVSDRDVEALARIEDYTRKKINSGWIEDEFLVTTYEAFPAERDLEYTKSNKPGFSKGKGPRSSHPRDGRRDKRKGDGPGSHKYSKGKKFSSNRRRHKDEGGREKEAGASVALESGAHRDRAMGRHKPKSSGNGKYESQRKRKFQKNRGARKRTNASQPRPIPSQSASLGQKIGGFFKKLFS
ncbi:MAG: DEAD/DEAH box helicase, partial [Bdellovibrionales bacterium]|nr:DEAD/DEAH box helicase [Bdellovibrionales bacterium]